MCKYEWSFHASCRHTVKTPVFCYYRINNYHHQTDIVPVGAPSSTYKPPALRCPKWRKYERPCLVVERPPKPKEGICSDCAFKMWVEEHYGRLMLFLRENGLDDGSGNQNQVENDESEENEEIETDGSEGEEKVGTLEDELGNDVREAERMAFLHTMDDMNIRQEEEKMEQQDIAEM